MVRQSLKLTALTVRRRARRRSLLLDLPEALGVPVADGGQLRILGRQARRAVRRPADECGVVDLWRPRISMSLAGHKSRWAWDGGMPPRTFDHSGWWFLILHCNDTAVMKSWDITLLVAP